MDCPFLPAVPEPPSPPMWHSGARDWQGQQQPQGEADTAGQALKDPLAQGWQGHGVAPPPIPHPGPLAWPISHLSSHHVQTRPVHPLPAPRPAMLNHLGPAQAMETPGGRL